MLTEETSCTVLHQLIQEQLRNGNSTDARTLLAIQQQALCSGGNDGVEIPRSSTDSHSQEERQEPQGQEHHADFNHAESYQLYHHHHEQLPTYEQAKANLQFFAKLCCQNGQICVPGNQHSKARTISEQLMQLSLQCKDNAEPLNNSSLWSNLEIAGYHDAQLQPESQLGFQHHEEVETFYQRPPPPFHSQHHRIVPPVPEVLPSVGEIPAQMELLLKENARLKQELQGHTEITCRVHKLEQEIKRITEAYDTLMQGCVKRETLEQTLRNKLMAENKRLQQVNTELRESLEDKSKQVAKDVEAADHNQSIISKLLMQKEEQQLHCARLEHEMQLLRDELSSAHIHRRQLQAELNRKIAYMEQVERLQGALAQLQAICEKRESLELRLRTRLEQELCMLRNQQRQRQTGPATTQASSAKTGVLLERLREQEERILALEADSTRREQKYLEEKTMREFAMDAAATAAAQRDTSIINNSPCYSYKSIFTEDLSHAELRRQEVENRICALYGQILEKDTVINVLQRWFQHEPVKGETASKRSHTNEQMISMAHFSCVAPAVCRTNEQGESVTETPTTEQMTSTEVISVDTKQKAVDPLKGLDNMKAEAVEVFI